MLKKSRLKAQNEACGCFTARCSASSVRKVHLYCFIDPVRLRAATRRLSEALVSPSSSSSSLLQDLIYTGVIGVLLFISSCVFAADRGPLVQATVAVVRKRPRTRTTLLFYLLSLHFSFLLYLLLSFPSWLTVCVIRSPTAALFFFSVVQVFGFLATGAFIIDVGLMVKSRGLPFLNKNKKQEHTNGIPTPAEEERLKTNETV